MVDALSAQLDAAQAAQAVISVIGADAPRQQILLMYERYLEAGRHQRLRPVLAAWNAALKEVVREVLTRADLPAEKDDARLVLAVADGVAVTAPAERTPADVSVGAALIVMFSRLWISAGPHGPADERDRDYADASAGESGCGPVPRRNQKSFRSCSWDAFARCARHPDACAEAPGPYTAISVRRLTPHGAHLDALASAPTAMRCPPVTAGWSASGPAALPKRPRGLGGH